MKYFAGGTVGRLAIVCVAGLGCGGQMGGGSPGAAGGGGRGTRDAGRDSLGGSVADGGAGHGSAGQGGAAGAGTAGGAGGARGGAGGARGGAGGATGGVGGGAQAGASGARCTTFQFQPSHFSGDAIFADMNKDGRPDVVAVWTEYPTTTSYISHFLIYPQTSPRVFADPVAHIFDVYNFNRITTYDLDKDGILDIAGSNFNGWVGLLLSAGGYVAGPPLRPMSNEDMFDVVAADLDGDGQGDIAVPLGSQTASIGIYWGTGGGNFSPRDDRPFCGEAAHAAVIDANEDGRPDLAISCKTAGSMVLVNQGNRKFTSTLLAGTTQGFALATGDLNHDGHVDVVVPDWILKQALVYLGDGHGSFSVPTGLVAKTGSNPTSGAIGDLDGDGNADLVIGDDTQSTIAFYRGTGDGHFQGAQAIPMSSGSNNLAVADVDGDGVQDLMIGNGPTIIYGPCP